jgi:hypothetical protein
MPTNYNFCGFCEGGQSLGALNGISPDYFSGQITFTGSAISPAAGYTFTAPVTFQGQIQGNNLEMGPNGDFLSPLWDITVAGSGTVTVYRNVAVSSVIGESYTFTGTATIIPEPSSLCLLMTALGGLALIRKHRSRT